VLPHERLLSAARDGLVVRELSAMCGPSHSRRVRAHPVAWTERETVTGA
jgi:hypothetical protein